MNYNSNANIRYHIFKELSKHRESISKTNLDRINDFAIPVFAGISTVLLAQVIDSESVLCGGWRIFFYLIAPPLFYLIIYNLARWIIRCFKKITPYFKQERKKNKGYLMLKEKEEAMARFDYEVSNLVHISYTLMIEKNRDKTLCKYNLMQSIHYTTNSLKKIEKSLLPNQLSISDNRIKVMLDIIKKTILLQLKSDKKQEFENEILNIIAIYNMLIERLNAIYKLNIDLITTS